MPKPVSISLDQNPRDLLIGALVAGSTSVGAHTFLPPVVASSAVLAVLLVAIPVCLHCERKAMVRKAARALGEDEPCETAEKHCPSRTLQRQTES